MRKAHLSVMRSMMYMLTDRSFFLSAKRTMLRRCRVSAARNAINSHAGDDEEDDE